jgi:GTP-binding protein
VYDTETNTILLDCLSDGKPELIAQGGRGGRGNSALVSRSNPNPDRCEEGKPGEEKKVRLVLKMLADAGLVGRPNAGKSTFLSRISKARPKIADYPFTTTRPHLGIVHPQKGYESFVVADIPGIIEECHTGKGLGIRFLKHIERTRTLVILIEATAPDPLAEAEVLLHELGCYSPALLEKPRLFVLTKKDILEDPDAAKLPQGWFLMSAVTGDGVDAVIQEMYRLIKETPSEDL